LGDVLFFAFVFLFDTANLYQMVYPLSCHNQVDVPETTRSTWKRNL